MNYFIFSFLILLVAGNIFSSPVSAGEPPSLVSRLSEYTKMKGPGLALMIVRNGKVIRKEGFGYADREKNILIDERTNFNIASNSKAFTAMAILILEQEGKLSGEDFASRYVTLPGYARDIKINHLVHHTSGLPDYAELCKSNGPVTNQQVLNFLGIKDSLVFAPGSKFDYSDTGYVILSEIIQRVSGQTFPSFISKVIFKKLGMAHTFIIPPEENFEIPRMAKAYSEWPFFQRNDSNPCDHVYGDGGVVTNLNDYARWIRGLTTSILVPKETLKKVWWPEKANDGSSVNYGYGWFIDKFLGYKMVTHTGSWLAHRALTAYFPEKDLWIVVLSNYETIPQLEIVKEIATEQLTSVP